VFDNVIAFEPDAENYECLTRNLEMHAHGPWSARRCALADARGTVSLEQHDPGNSGALRVAREGGDVPMARLDDLLDLDEDVGLIKVDVEGFEPHVLLGAEETIRRCRPVIVFEQSNSTPGLRPTLARRILEWWGYGLRLTLGKNLVMTDGGQDDAVQEETEEGPGILICR
jgi:FkbM family methyltransferase